MRVHLGLGGREQFLRRLARPQFDGEGVNVMVQPPARRDADQFEQQAAERRSAIFPDGHAMEGHSHIFAHILHPRVLPVSAPCDIWVSPERRRSFSSSTERRITRLVDAWMLQSNFTPRRTNPSAMPTARSRSTRKLSSTIHNSSRL